MKQSWEIKKLGEVYDVRDGTHDSPKYVKEGYALITSKNLKNDSLNYDNVNYITEQDYISINKRSKVDVGDVLFAMIGTIGNPIVIKDEPDFAIKNVALFKVPKNQDSHFLKYYLDSGSVIERMSKDAKGATQKFVGLGYLRNFEIPLPPLPEQQRIVSILDEAFAAIAKAKANAEQNLKNAKELFESYLQGVFENGNWEERVLGDLCLLITKGSSPKWQGIKYIDEPGILFVTSENVGEGKMLLNERKYVEEKFNLKDKKSILKKGDVLTNIVGASIGRTAIYDIDDIANINQAVCILRCNPKLILNNYLMILLNSPFLKKILHDNEVNTARANLSLGFFNKLSIPCPSIEVQQTIVLQLDALRAETQKLEAVYQKKITDLEELKKSILQKAFAGELKTEKAVAV